jgi:hypothetical protein
MARGVEWLGRAWYAYTADSGQAGRQAFQSGGKQVRHIARTDRLRLVRLAPNPHGLSGIEWV